MARKGQFKRGGGRVGSRSTAMTHRPRAKARTRTITKTRTVHVRGARKTHRRRRHGGGSSGGMPRLLPLAGATALLAYVTNEGGPAFVTQNIAKIPGAKTFGGTTVAGLACLAVDRFVKPNKWLKLFGLAGVVLGAAQVGKQGTSFKWVGDDETGDMDISDVGDDDVDDEDVGDGDGWSD